MTNQYDPAIENTEETIAEIAVETASAEEAASPAAPVKRRPVTRRYNKKGRRIGKYAYAAPLGMLISFLSILGVVAIIISGIGAIHDARLLKHRGERKHAAAGNAANHFDLCEVKPALRDETATVFCHLVEYHYKKEEEYRAENAPGKNERERGDVCRRLLCRECKAPYSRRYEH